MDIGFVGLGKMGLNMVTRLTQGGHRVVAFDRDSAKVADAVRSGCTGAASLEELIAKLPAPRAVWIMVPAGPPTEDTVRDVTARLGAGDVVIEGFTTWMREPAAACGG
jgi:6-phosphogluconate dehydrogenase